MEFNKPNHEANTLPCSNAGLATEAASRVLWAFPPGTLEREWPALGGAAGTRAPVQVQVPWRPRTRDDRDGVES